MNIKPSAAIRQNYNEISETYNRREKMLQLRETLLSVEEDRLAGKVGCSLDDLEHYLDSIISEA